MNIWLFLHVFGVVLFLGNIVTAAFWKVRADLKKDPDLIHQTVKNVMVADYAFTLPGILLIIASGNVMAVQSGYSMGSFNWLTLSSGLFIITGLIWLVILIPIQRKMIQTSAQSVVDGAVSNQYRKASLNWAVFGTAATLLPVVILFLMVTKAF